MWPWLAIALAQSPTSGTVALVTSPEARVEVLPRSREDVVELAVYGNRVPLADQIDTLSPPHVRTLAARSIGGGTWFVTIQIDDPTLVAAVRPSADGWVVRLQPGTKPPTMSRGTPSYAAILDGTARRRVDPPPAMAASYLQGDAATLTLDPRTYTLGVPEWEPHNLPDVEAGWLAPGDPTPEQIEKYRRVLTESGSSRAKQAAQYRLARAYLDVGLPREARYYLARVAEVPGYAPPAAIALWQAQAALGSGLVDEARSRCKAAAAAGAAEPRVLECLGLVSLVTSDPPPGAVGRQFAPYAASPEEQVLAAELLLRDGDRPGARALLEAAVVPDSGVRALAFANLADLDLADGDLVAAQRGYERAALDPSLTPVVRVRQILLAMLEDGPTSWASQVPILDAWALQPGRPGAEALHLLAQIGAMYGDPELEAQALGELLTEHPSIARRGDVPERLLHTCLVRLDQLDRLRRDVEQVAFFDACWHRELDAMIRDTAPLEAVARALARLGLPEEALDVQRDVLAIHAREAREDVGALTALAELYVVTDRPTEAIDTVTYTERLGPGAVERARLGVVRGDALVGLGRFGEAVAAYPRGAPDPDVAAAAARGRALAVLARDGCTRARPDLEAASTDPDVALALARCLATTDPATAIEKATALAEVPELAPDARWIVGLAAVEARAPDGVTHDDPLWSALLAEETGYAALQAEVRAHR